ncbi:VOC family protein [Sandarakinorhabdus sp.]|uniref:VOC family protein n=1 Tax=Sandarakinorhabdus sp. TaxID=1916663 RepID=UPI00286E2A56|nr:VOC family protein [Sandarakinorhabdus sp.]
MASLGQTVRTCWWLPGNGLDAVNFWTSLLPDSQLDGAVNKDGTALIIEFTLAGAPMMVLNASGGPAANMAASISVLTDDQAETDRLWAALTADGGKEVACSWVTDRFGVSWQIVPRLLPQLFGSSDTAAAARAFAAMQTMVKIDIAAVQAAFDG